MMMEAAKVSGFGDDRQCIDRPDAWDLSQELVVLAVPQQFVGLRFDLVALPDQTSSLGDDHPKHTNGRGIKRQRQSDGCACRLVNIH